MSEQITLNAFVAAASASLKERAELATAFQDELGKRLAAFNQHWLERIQANSTDVYQFLSKMSGTPAIGEKVKLYEQWIEGATKRSIDDLAYVLEGGRSLGELGMKCFAACAKQQTAETTPPINTA